MPGILFIAAAAGLVWAWWTGRLKNFTYEDGVAAAVFLLGLRLMTTGRVLPGSALMAGALLGSLPVAFVYSFFVEYYVSGMTGSVKE